MTTNNDAKSDDRARSTLLIDEEVAARLRCSKFVVKRLRLSGKLPYLPGRPPRVDEADLDSYIAQTKRRGRAPDAEAKAEDAAIGLKARRLWLKHRFKHIR